MAQRRSCATGKELIPKKWEWVEKDGYLGFICRASTASYHGAYLGHNSDEYLICEAQCQKGWEDFQVIKEDEGCKWEMHKGDRITYVCKVDGYKLKMLHDRTTSWGFTEWI
jgi:hypothetical protein